MKLLLTLIFLFISTLIFFPSPIFAAAIPLCHDDKGIETALGCLPFEPLPFIQAVFPWAVGLSGGIAILLIIIGTLNYITAAGNPEKMQEAQQQVTSALVGLLIVIFATVLLKLIGVDILGLKSFGF